MDKLREILVYRFWMLLGIALIVPLVGWWIGSGDAASAISARKNQINAAYQAIPKGEFVNDTWINGVKNINEEQQQLIDAAWEKLAEGQINLKTWPPVIAGPIAELGPEEGIHLNFRNIYYPRAYHREWAEVWLIVNPVRNGKLDIETNKAPTMGIVDFSIDNLPVQKWGDVAPTTKQMREAQEDIWLYRSLLEAIADVNDGVENRADAVITKIDSLELLSGLASKPELEKFEKPENVDPPVVDPADKTVKKDKKGRDKDTGRGGASRTKGIGGYIDDSPAMADNFFLDAVELSKASSADDDPFGGFDEQETDDDGFKPTEKRRYVEELDQYNILAFNMVVEMDHRRLPDLLASLSDSPWPIKILRVEQSNGDNSKGGGGRKHGRAADEDDNDNVFSGSTGQFSPNARPYQAKVEITGTMRIFKSMPQSPAATVADEATSTNSDAQQAPQLAANPSFRSAELEDTELLLNITDQMKEAEGSYGFGGSRRGRNRPGANSRGGGNGLLRIGDGKGER